MLCLIFPVNLWNIYCFLFLGTVLSLFIFLMQCSFIRCFPFLPFSLYSVIYCFYNSFFIHLLVMCSYRYFYPDMHNLFWSCQMDLHFWTMSVADQSIFFLNLQQINQIVQTRLVEDQLKFIWKKNPLIKNPPPLHWLYAGYILVSEDSVVWGIGVSARYPIASKKKDNDSEKTLTR